MKKIYVKPERETLLAGSVTSINTSLDDADDLLIDTTTPIDDSFWGR